MPFLHDFKPKNAISTGIRAKIGIFKHSIGIIAFKRTWSKNFSRHIIVVLSTIIAILWHWSTYRFLGIMPRKKHIVTKHSEESFIIIRKVKEGGRRSWASLASKPSQARARCWVSWWQCSSYKSLDDECQTLAIHQQRYPQNKTRIIRRKKLTNFILSNFIFERGRTLHVQGTKTTETLCRQSAAFSNFCSWGAISAKSWSVGPC